MKTHCIRTTARYGILLFIPLLASCSGQLNKKEKDTSTSGMVTIGADYEYEPVTTAEIEVFQALYNRAKIRTVFTTEDSAFALLLKDSVRLIIASRKLTPDEENYFHSLKLYPEQMKVATDALVLIVNKINTDTLFTLQQLKSVFMGKDSNWMQAGEVHSGSAPRAGNDSSSGKLRIVFDYENSGNSRYIIQHLAENGKLPDYCYTLHGNTEVINYVSKNRNALGIIGVNWISNIYDTSVIRNLREVNIIAISKKESPSLNDFFKPYPENIQYGYYPLCRDVYIVSREAYTGLGSGFFSFVTSNRGQRIIYRDGLAPIAQISHTISF